MDNLPSLFGNSNRGQDPFRAMARMQREMDRMFRDFWSEGAAGGSGAASRPFYDVEEKGSHYLLSFHVPGFGKDDLKIEMLGNQLHVWGEKKREEGKDRGFSYGSIEQWFTLPQDVKAEAIEARVENGVLQIAVPKSESSQAKQIKIGDEKGGFFSKLLGKKESAA